MGPQSSWSETGIKAVFVPRKALAFGIMFRKMIPLDSEGWSGFHYQGTFPFVTYVA